MDLPELMTVRDFLDNFRMGKTTFYRHVESGQLKIVKVGRATRIARIDAETWLSSLRISSAAGS